MDSPYTRVLGRSTSSMRWIVLHRRAVWLAPIDRVGIELVLEVRDEAHGQAVMHHLTTVGYHVEREGQGLWPG